MLVTLSPAIVVLFIGYILCLVAARRVGQQAVFLVVLLSLPVVLVVDALVFFVGMQTVATGSGPATLTPLLNSVDLSALIAILWPIVTFVGTFFLAARDQ
jgi:hypothetical protein